VSRIRLTGLGYLKLITPILRTRTRASLKSLGRRPPQTIVSLMSVSWGPSACARAFMLDVRMMRAGGDIELLTMLIARLVKHQPSVVTVTRKAF